MRPMIYARILDIRWACGEAGRIKSHNFKAGYRVVIYWRFEIAAYKDER
jgi:hypothetical protein